MKLRSIVWSDRNAQGQRCSVVVDVEGGEGFDDALKVAQGLVSVALGKVSRSEAIAAVEGDYAARLFAARMRAGLTQAQLADRLGWQASAVSHHETGRRTPSVENLKALCEALGVSADYLLGRGSL